ncbi:MAG: hypothetical protein PHC86_06525 [Eubacteriales bacterium]|nr:hypothetical protein [Eubacteriales bacterium]
MAPEISALKSTQSWAIPVVDPDHIPEQFVAAFHLYFRTEEAPYMLYNPRQDSDRSLSDEKLICLTKDRLVIICADRSTFLCRPDDVLTVHLEELLLAYSFTICTAVDEIKIDYNAACADLFEPIVTSLRTKGTVAKDGHTEWQRLRALADIDLKFANYARQILRESGRLLELILQPEIIYEKHIIAETSLLILTETELVWVINDRKQWVEEPVYGATINITPITQLINCTVIDDHDYGQIHLTVSINGDKTWTIPFTPDRREELEQFTARITK